MADYENNKDERFSLTEMFLVKADWERTFVGSLNRCTVDGKPVLRGKVVVQEGYIVGAANIEEELFQAMDSICILKLDHDLHGSVGPMFDTSVGSINQN
jgi:hypothetical protein